jgi:hypothetical protein
VDIRDLTAALDELSWREQVEFELGERYPGHQGDAEILERLQRLGKTLTPALLDELERKPGYIAWVLRLSPSVPGDDPVRRARRYQSDGDPDIRYWAGELLK